MKIGIKDADGFHGSHFDRIFGSHRKKFQQYKELNAMCGIVGIFEFKESREILRERALQMSRKKELE